MKAKQRRRRAIPLRVVRDKYGPSVPHIINKAQSRILKQKRGILRTEEIISRDKKPAGSLQRVIP